jgi:DNA-binding LytR/AlgR family response regulator
VAIWAAADEGWARLVRRIADAQLTGTATTLVGAARLALVTAPDIMIVSTPTVVVDAVSLHQRVPAARRPLLVLAGDIPADAVGAFEVGAFDFISRSEPDTRLESVLERARERREQDGFVRLLASIARGWPETEPRPSPHQTIPLRSGGRRVLVRAADIEVIEACGNYVRVVTPARHFLHRATMKECLALLRDAGFFRAHRRYIVNREHLVERQRGGTLVLRSGRTIVTGRRYRAA